jgi:hypothetical protein
VWEERGRTIADRLDGWGEALFRTVFGGVEAFAPVIGVQFLNQHVTDLWWAISCSSFAMSYLVYRLSLSAQSQYGLYFKALFDRFHADVRIDPGRTRALIREAVLKRDERARKVGHGEPLEGCSLYVLS